MGQVRPLVEDDIPQVAELHARIIGGSDRPALPVLTQIFCRHPWSDKDLPSLVYQQGNGDIAGVLGVMPRPMSMNGRPLQAAITHTFMVDPRSRSTLVALQLLKAYLTGPQDLTLAEGNELSRKLGEGLGVTTSLIYSIRWTRALRPSQYVLSVLNKRGLHTRTASVLKPFSHVVDAIAAHMRQGPFRQSKPRFTEEELDGETLRACVSEISQHRSLRPRYDTPSLNWLLDLLGEKKGRGILRKVLLRDSRREIAGWYLYYSNPKGMSEVVQVGATPASISEVLDHLFYDAWGRGAVAVSGQLDPVFSQAVTDKDCLFRPGGGSVLIHSRHPDVLQAINRGDAFLTRLEGEWCIAFVLS
jgi:hypothetical protein